MAKSITKEQQEILKNYNNSIVTGIISGIIVYVVIFVHNIILEKTNFIVFAFLGGILTLFILYYLFVTRPIRKQEAIWNAKKVKWEKLKFKEVLI